MKAIVLAGGHATRLWPLTKHRAKPLLPLGDRPIIAYVLEELADIDDVDDVLISTNAKFADDFRAFLADRQFENTRVVVEDHVKEENKVGSLGAMIQVMEAEGLDDYLVVGGDNYTTLSLQDFLNFARERDAITNACYQLDQEADASQFGVITADDDQHVTGFEEKPDAPSSTLVSTAFYYFPEHQLDIFDAYQDAFQGTDTDYLDEPGRLIEWGHQHYNMYAYPFTGDWYDIGTPENYLEAQAALMDGRKNNGSVADTELGDNVWVMDGAEIQDSRLKHCIVFPGAKITGAELDGCIIDEQAIVNGKVLDGAVIGAHSTVQ